MKKIYDTIYLSPHLDDAALSCGGQVYMQTTEGQAVLIVTVMAGDPPQQAASDFVQVLHDRWQLQTDVVAGRRAEDTKACRILGADYVHWDFPDCIYRTHHETNDVLYSSNEDIFGAIHPSEAALVDTVLRQIERLPEHDRLFAPLGVGNHVDHQITHQAAKNAGSDRLVFYEEYPYVIIPGALETAVEAQVGPMQPRIIPLSEAALSAKIEAVAAYESQMSTFFRDRTDLENALRQNNELTGGERIWQSARAA